MCEYDNKYMIKFEFPLDSENVKIKNIEYK